MSGYYAVYCKVCNVYHCPDATNRAVLAAEIVTFSAAHQHQGTDISVRLSAETEPAAEDA